MQNIDWDWYFIFTLHCCPAPLLFFFLNLGRTYLVSARHKSKRFYKKTEMLLQI